MGFEFNVNELHSILIPEASVHEHVEFANIPIRSCLPLDGAEYGKRSTGKHGKLIT